MAALSLLFEALPAAYPLPVIVVQHRNAEEKSLLEELLQARCRIRVKQADEKERITGGTVYLAPPGYHLLIENNRSFSLSCEGPVNFSRPSVDVLFESAAEVYESRLLGIILTGANQDGAAGIRAVRERGGTTIAQDPATAAVPLMPRAAIGTGCVQHIFELTEIRDHLISIGKC